MQTQTQSMNKARAQTAKQIVGFSRISRELISQDFTFKSNQTGKQKRDPSSECAMQLGKKTKKTTLSRPPLTCFSAFSVCARTQPKRLEMRAIYLGEPAASTQTCVLPRSCTGVHTRTHAHTHAGDNGGGWGGRLRKEKWRMHAGSLRRCEDAR